MHRQPAGGAHLSNVVQTVLEELKVPKAPLQDFLLPDDSPVVSAWLAAHTRGQERGAAQWQLQHQAFRRQQLQSASASAVSVAELGIMQAFQDPCLTARERDSLHTHIAMALQDDKLREGVWASVVGPLCVSC